MPEMVPKIRLLSKMAKLMTSMGMVRGCRATRISRCRSKEMMLRKLMGQGQEPLLRKCMMLLSKRGKTMQKNLAKIDHSRFVG